MLRDSSGNKSLTHTITVVAFAVVMVKLLLNGASMSIASSTYTFGSIDAASIAAVLGPTLGSYVARRWSGPTANNAMDDAGGKPGDGAA